MLFIVSAPSGAGKTSLVRALLQHPDPGLPISLSVSSTTRQPRTGEVDGVDYHFRTREAFEQMIGSGGFLEWAEVHGNLYGTERQPVLEAMAAGRHVLLEIDWQGAQQVRRAMPPEQVVSVFILPPSMTELERRLRARGTDSDEVISLRLAAAEMEMQQAPAFHHKIVNNEFSAALAEFHAVIRRAALPSPPQSS